MDTRLSTRNSIFKFGRNPDCDPKGSATAVPVGRDIWDLGIAGASAWVPPTVARIHQLASSNDEDGGAGSDTGALTMLIEGLDTDYKHISETLALNGTTNVPTTLAYLIIYRMVVATAGSAGRNLGNIDATADTDGTVTARVTIDNNQTLMAIYQIPAGKIGRLLHWRIGILKVGGGAKFCDGFLMSKTLGGVWRVRDITPVATDSNPTSIVIDERLSFFEEKESIKVVGDPSAVAQDVHACFGLALF